VNASIRNSAQQVTPACRRATRLRHQAPVSHDHVQRVIFNAKRSGNGFRAGPTTAARNHLEVSDRGEINKWKSRANASRMSERQKQLSALVPLSAPTHYWTTIDIEKMSSPTVDPAWSRKAAPPPVSRRRGHPALRQEKGLAIRSIYMDPGVSGSSLDRPDLQRD